MEQKVRTLGKVNWALWLNSEKVRQVNPRFDLKSQWVRNENDLIPLFNTPEEAIEWAEDWISNKDWIKFYEAKEFSRGVVNG